MTTPIPKPTKSTSADVRWQDVAQIRKALRAEGIEMAGACFQRWNELAVAIDVWLEGGWLELPEGLYWTRSGYRDTVAIVTLEDCLAWIALADIDTKERHPSCLADGPYRLGWSSEPMASPPGVEGSAAFVLGASDRYVAGTTIGLCLEPAGWPRHFRHPTVPGVGYMHRPEPSASLYNHVRNLMQGYLLDRVGLEQDRSLARAQAQRRGLFGAEVGRATEDCPHEPRDRHFRAELEAARLVPKRIRIEPTRSRHP